MVASIGDLKLLALFGVLVLKSFFLPMNITLSLLKLGFITPSWPEPSLSDDLEKVEIRNIFLCHDDLDVLDLTGSTWKEIYICGWCSSSYPSNNRHTVIKHYTVSLTDTTSLLASVITQNQNMSRRISCSTPAELSVKLIIHKFTRM